ncbi:ABC transporter substrate-binding protein [Parashewanella curva]|uniref:ABC transporter substrate-binding protein n=1 Tax=Parashewanella curva TaxID=2338552 RepID=A0A3L8PVE5_9GAMM|nr:ABC transporter substrate-binding protein [Parashewanella curva]RLV59330.1 ABC transporter substrate-binding protein [Parashewanella curva]
MKLARNRFILVLAVCLSLITLSGCQPQNVPIGLVYCSEGNPESFNPQIVTLGTTIDASSHQIYNHLIEYDVTTGKVSPSLATSWQVSKDGKVYTFKLRKGVKFHRAQWFTPSRNFNALDVLFSFNRIIRADNPYHDVSATGYPFFQSIGFQSLVKDISAPDLYTVTFTLNRPDASFLANLASDFAVVLSQEYADFLLKAGTPQRIDQFAIGTGPFVLKQYVKNEYIRYQRNNDYWGKRTVIEHLVFDITRKNSQRLAKLLTDDCGVSALPKPLELKVANQYPHVQIQQQRGMNVAFWAFNTLKPPFDDPEVRQALAMAINKSDILSVVYRQTAVEADSILPPASWAHSINPTHQGYNPVKAKQILQKKGLTNLRMNILTMPTARTYNPNPVKTAQLIQADLAKVGIKAHIHSNDWRVLSKKLNRSQYDSVLLGWNADNSDPDNFFSPFLSCAALKSNNNRSQWCDTKFDSILEQAKTVTDQADRKKLYQKAEMLLSEQMPLVPLAHSNRIILKRTDIKGVKLASYGGISFAKAYHNKEQND